MPINISEEYLIKRWNSLTISNDFLFCKVMQNPEICRKMLERILGFPIAGLRFPDAQKTIDPELNSHGVRLDIYTDDGKRIYNVEMQTVNYKDLARRSRYYGSMIDVQEHNRGVYYKYLKDQIVIFICTFDVFGKGLHRYTFEYSCKEDPVLKLEDGTTKIFLNCKSSADDVDTSLRGFLDYVAGGAVSDSLTEEIEKEVRKAKQNLEWRHTL